MKKEEAEKAIRYVCHEWAKLRGVNVDPMVQPDFGDFLAWVRENYSPYLSFRTTTSATDDVGMWFDQEFKQSWRN